MKKITLILFLSFISLKSFCNKNLKIEIPSLVYKTLKTKLKSRNFYKQTLFLNVDTLSDKNSIWDFEYNDFTNKKDFLNEFSKLNSFLQNKQIIDFLTLDDNYFYDSKRHWILKVSENGFVYNIDWWFSEYNANKLKGITITLIEKGNF